MGHESLQRLRLGRSEVEINPGRDQQTVAVLLQRIKEGVVLAIVHVLIALGYTYGWNHELAVRETARQAGEVYGFGWRGSIYVSYAFLVVWAIDAWRGQTLMRHWIMRAFFLTIIINGAIVFASPLGRVLGAAVVAILLWAWRPVDSARRRPGL